jgi:hypothetical protein
MTALYRLSNSNVLALEKRKKKKEMARIFYQATICGSTIR